MQKNAQSYVKNAVLLTASDLILRLAGMGFRIYLAKALGEEGMGLYQLTLAFYAVFITVATAGVSVAATRLVAEELHRGVQAVRVLMRRLLWIGFCFGAFAMFMQFALAGVAGRFWIGDVRAVLSIRAAAFALPSMALAAVLRGFFLACRRVQPNVYSQMVEQVVRIGVIVCLLFKTEGASLGVRCAVVLVGTALSETVSCGVMAWHYWRTREEEAVRETSERAVLSGSDAYKAQCEAEDVCGNSARVPCLNHRIWEIVWPVAGGRFLASALHTAENMLVPACLAVYLIHTGGRTQALAQYGVLKGMVMPLLVFPMGLLGSLATLLMPEITQAHVRKKDALLARLLDKMFVITMYASVLGGVAFFLFAEPLGQLLYGSAQTSLYLRILAPMAPFMYVENMVTGALKGLGEQKATFWYSAIDSTLRIVGVVLLLPRFGMLSFLVVVCMSNFYTCIMNTRRLLRVTQLPCKPRQWLVYPLCSAGVAALACQFVMEKAVVLEGAILAFVKVQIEIEWCAMLLWRFAPFVPMLCGGFVLCGVYLAIGWGLGLKICKSS